MSMERKPVDWKICATCANWLGRRTPDHFVQYVDFDNKEKAHCIGPWSHASDREAKAFCESWKPQFKK